MELIVNLTSKPLLSTRKKLVVTTESVGGGGGGVGPLGWRNKHVLPLQLNESWFLSVPARSTVTLLWGCYNFQYRVYKLRKAKTKEAVYNNETLKRVRITIVAMERQKVLHFLNKCSLSYLSCKAHAPYYVHMSSVACPAYNRWEQLFG